MPNKKLEPNHFIRKSVQSIPITCPCQAEAEHENVRPPASHPTMQNRNSPLKKQKENIPPSFTSLQHTKGINYQSYFMSMERHYCRVRCWVVPPLFLPLPLFPPATLHSALSLPLSYSVNTIIGPSRRGLCLVYHKMLFFMVGLP